MMVITEALSKVNDALGNLSRNHDANAEQILSVIASVEDAETRENLYKAQIQALSDQNDFFEECLVEIAEIIYA